MYESVDRMNKHYRNKNFEAAEAEKLLQKHLRKNFTYVRD